MLMSAVIHQGFPQCPTTEEFHTEFNSLHIPMYGTYTMSKKVKTNLRTRYRSRSSTI